MGDFLGGPVARTLCSSEGDLGSIPSQGAGSKCATEDATGHN